MLNQRIKTHKEINKTKEANKNNNNKNNNKNNNNKNKNNIFIRK